ncbi:LytR/AlgR family response regulator transcription factor [Acutalibacter sp. 1XD8-36]|uniref:LytR/AlgR family response regulator transcription factor n=1 Tax=Acutalibacter sp. 1XD8-36 TaxID=2320852 RepID=UPI0014123EF5|nr:LytTR family DNA-binding domain-containing protein [Acutalibacter sp. 1XD8-36]NBJ88256.1 DNA-binding response regulator [Acutalibacter sp. 1XD8-36]
MYRIIIGDDDTVFLEEAAGIVSECLTAEGLVQGVDFNIDCYSKAEPLIDALERGKEGCLLLLDVEFGDVNGLSAAASLREKELEFRLIYITSYRDYVFDSFDTQPLHYLLKPVNKEKLAGLIRDDLRRQYLDARIYLKAGSKHLSIAYSDIYAVEAAQHRIIFHLKNGVEEWSGTLRELAQTLPGWCFCRCHNSYIVNFSHVTELVRYQAKLDNDIIIPISKRFYKPAIEQYMEFLKN